MRRTLTIGFTLIAIVALSGVTAFAYVDPYAASPHPIMGPRLSPHMVARRDVGTPGPAPTPYNPSKPIPVVEAVAGSGPGLSGLAGHEGRGSTSVVAVTPQMRLESSLKSLAQELR